MRKRIMALILCFTMVFTMTGYVGFGDYSYAYAEGENIELLENELEEQTVNADYNLFSEPNTLSKLNSIMMLAEIDEPVLLDLSKGSITITSSGYEGYNSAGTKVTGTSNNIKVTTSSKTGNSITFNGSDINCNLTLKDVTRNGGIGITYDHNCKNSDVTILLEGNNTIGQLYYTGDSKLKITSASGDGSTSGKLTATAAEEWSAAIGGTDGDESFSGLTIAGGTINATATCGAAIGGGGNGSAVVKITGGNVTATNEGTSAAIGGGGGQTGSGGNATITIEGGTVTAKCTGNGVAIGAGGSVKSSEVGVATVNLLGGTITAKSSSQYAISGGYSQANGKYNTTNVKISDSVRYDADINPNATVTGNMQFVFDLAKGSVIFTGNSFSGKDSNGNAITGTHKESNKYIVRQSNNKVATENSIQLKNKITGTVNMEIDGINSSAKDSISIPAAKGAEKEVVLSLKNNNTVNNILYYTIAKETSRKGEESTSKLKITSASGDGSKDGKLTVIPTKGSGADDGSVHYNAGIGGTDGKSGVTGLHIAGGTLYVETDASNDCSAIGGGGNGYAQIKITGGYINAKNASTGATIGGGVGYTAPGSGCDIEITGGTVIAENTGKYKTGYIKPDGTKAWCYGVAIGGGSSYEQSSAGDIAKVTITGGNVTAIVPEGQTAIGAGNSNKSDAGEAVVTITNGTVDCIGGIGGGSTITGNGGNGTLIVSGGNVTVKGFIGGGTTKNGDKGGTATVDISGAGTIVKAASIGGGVAETKNVASKANVKIEDGDIQAQVVMEGEGSTFDMSGGTIDNSKAAAEGFVFKMENGGAVYVAKGTATMTGGTIQNCTSNGDGGAIYVTGGDFTLSGTGKITNTSAANDGGAVYVNTGNVIIEGGIIENTEAKYGGSVCVEGGSFTITSGIIQNSNATKDGGAVYVNGGTVTIGKADCDGTGAHSHPVLKNNTAVNGGAVAVTTGTPVMYCANFEGNTAEENGGSIYVANGGFTMNGGAISGGKLEESELNAKLGGAVYVSGGTFTMNDGTISRNKAKNGGATYVAESDSAKGNFVMNNGTLSNNIAIENGGAAYISGGNYTMEDGTVNDNTATDYGGAVYVNNGNVTMTSGVVKNNTTTAKKSVGGGFYVNGGSIIIGLPGCNGHGDNHNDDSANKNHPQVINNKAQDSGGGIALVGKGNITMHCGTVVDNKAINPGRGLNIYMENGIFTFNKGDIGKANEDGTYDPNLVIVGGTLVNNKIDETTDISFNYYHCNNKDCIHTGDLAVKTATATKGAEFNLPDGEKYWVAKDGYRFFGWTFFGPNSEGAKENVRSKKDYLEMGLPIEADGSLDGVDDKDLHMYALWAPETSYITYKGVVIDNVYQEETLNVNGNPTQYDFKVESSIVTLNSPVKDGYTFTGWYLYQDEGQNANWGNEYEPVYLENIKSYETLDYQEMKADQFISVDEDGYCRLEMGTTNFGNITLVAEFKPAFADLKVTKVGWDSRDENQTFVFKITGRPDNPKLSEVDMTVTICGNGSVVVKDLPVGKYEVKEVTEWSWRYRVLSAFANRVTLENPDKVKETKIINSRVNNFWLSGDSFVDNLWSNANRLIPREKLN